MKWRTILFRLAFLVSCLFVWSFSQTIKSVTIEGMGYSQSQALDDAKRKAVEKGIGQIVASESIVKNYSLFSDQIISRSDGFVKSYEILNSYQDTDGLWHVQIKADVTAIIDEVIKDQLAVDLLLQWLNKPRFMIVIMWEGKRNVNSQTVEVEIGRIMSEKHFSIITGTDVSGDVDFANLESVLRYARDNGANLLVYGEATGRTVSLGQIGYGNLGDVGMQSGQATVSARVIRVDTGEILAQNTFKAASPHIESGVAITKALQKASQKVADYLMQETIRQWSEEQSNYQTYLLVISPVEFLTMKKIQDRLIELPGVKAVRRKSFQNGKVEFQVDYKMGRIDDLAAQLSELKIDSIQFIITGLSDYSLTIQVEY